MVEYIVKCPISLC